MTADLTPQNPRFIISLLIISNILGSMSMDIHLPLAPTIMVDLNTTEFMVQLLFIISTVLTTMAPLFWGPLSDCYGRRRLFLPACYFMIVGQFGCWVAPTIEWLLFMRVIQYLGVGAILTVTMAVICDLYQGTARAKKLALLEMSMPFALAVAPIIGAYVANYLSWRYNFLFLGILQTFLLGILLKCMPETLQTPKPFEWRQSYQALSSILTNRLFMQYVLLFAMVNASYMVFITHASFIFINGFNFSPTLFSLNQGLLVFVYFLGLVFYRWFVKYTSVPSILNTSMLIYVGYGALVCAILAGILPFNPVSIVGTMIISCLVSGPIITSCNSLALTSCNDYLGTSSATIEFTIGSVAGVFMFLSSYFFNDSFVPVYTVIATTVLLSIGIWFNLTETSSLKKERKV